MGLLGAAIESGHSPGEHLQFSGDIPSDELWQRISKRHQSLHRTSFVEGGCPNDLKPKAIHGVAPACLESNGDCANPDEFVKLRKFAKEADETVADQLREAKRFRQIFERRTCDYKYAELQDDKEPMFEHVYGADGPLVPGGSYLYAMRRWVDALHGLRRTCLKGQGGCSSMISYLKEHPEDDRTKDGAHGKAGSGVYNEFRIACDVGKSRSPVPNDGPIWCSVRTGLCEQPSCRKWWEAIHHQFHHHPEPWVDDRSEYDDLREVCNWIHDKAMSSAEVDVYQRKLAKEVKKLKHEYCHPKWIEGYCEKKVDNHFYEECHLAGNRMCHRGIVSNGTDLDSNKGWTEEFPEAPVSGDSAPPPELTLFLSPPTLPGRARSSASEGRGARSNFDDFL